MPYPRPISLDEVIEPLLKRVREVVGLNENNCFASQLEQMPFDGLGDRYCWLRFDEPLSPDEPIWVGGNRTDPREWVVATVTCRTRQALDQRQMDPNWLRHHLRFRHQVYDALWGFQPEDAEQNVLTVAPLDPRPGSKPQKMRDMTEWGESKVRFLFCYVLNLNQEYQ